MRILILLLCLQINALALTDKELSELESSLGSGLLVSNSFIEDCYALVSREENPRHVKFLSQLLEMAQTKDREEVKKYLLDIKTVLKCDR